MPSPELASCSIEIRIVSTELQWRSGLACDGGLSLHLLPLTVIRLVLLCMLSICSDVELRPFCCKRIFPKLCEPITSKLLILLLRWTWCSEISTRFSWYSGCCHCRTCGRAWAKQALPWKWAAKQHLAAGSLVTQAGEASPHLAPAGTLFNNKNNS